MVNPACRSYIMTGNIEPWVDKKIFRGEAAMSELLTQLEKSLLLKLARQSLDHAVRSQQLPPLHLAALTPALQAQGASFVTLTNNGALRGCVGALEPYQSLAEDVREHAVAAGMEDYRFPHVQANELNLIQIEISRLTLPQPLVYVSTEDLLASLNPGLDGVILRDGWKRATFLPQVWDQVGGKEEFLSQLCYKMGVARDLWRRKHLDVLIYHVEEFHE
jgi:AmmeMemoRadiSam system protein A